MNGLFYILQTRSYCKNSDAPNIKVNQGPFSLSIQTKLNEEDSPLSAKFMMDPLDENATLLHLYTEKVWQMQIILRHCFLFSQWTLYIKGLRIVNNDTGIKLRHWQQKPKSVLNFDTIAYNFTYILHLEVARDSGCLSKLVWPFWCYSFSECLTYHLLSASLQSRWNSKIPVLDTKLRKQTTSV